MIKRWLQFINESKTQWWVSEEEIHQILKPITDQDYGIHIDLVFFDKKEDKFEIIDTDLVLDITKEYYPGFTLTIVRPNTGGKYDDVTLDLRNFISYMRSNGYIDKISDDEGETPTSSIHLIDGQILTWIPEKPGKKLTRNEDDIEAGDILIHSNHCQIQLIQEESSEIFPLDLAKFYDWYDYKVVGNNISFETQIDDLSRYLLCRRAYDRWHKLLIDGLDISDYYSSDYQPDIHSLFQYYLNKENEVLAIKALIKETGGLENFIEESDNQQLIGKSEEEVIDFLLKERYYRTLESLASDSEIIGEIKVCYADWSSQAHCDENEKEMFEAFDEILEDEKIEFTKEWKLGKRTYQKQNKETGRTEKVEYEEMMWIYQISFDPCWITEFEKTMKGYSLESVFVEWRGEKESWELEPNFSDWGDIDKDAFNREIGDLLKKYLQK